MNREYRLLSTYNRMRIIPIIEQLLTQKGAQILRTRFAETMEIKCYTNETSESKKHAIEELPIITVTNKHLSLHFILNGYYYYFSFDDNPFFPMYYQKIKINEQGEYIGKRYLYSSDDDTSDTLKATLCYDKIFSIVDDVTIYNMACSFIEEIDMFLSHGNENTIVSERKRVYDYDGKYHYTNVYDKTKCSIYTNEYIRKED